MQFDTVIVGAGLAGLSAARACSGTLLVLEKGRSPGGRLATRRMVGAGGVEARLDHGAQFFTVRSERFGAVAHEWIARGIAREWCRGFSSGGDGHPRFVGVSGMNALAKSLAASLPVRCGTEVTAVTIAGEMLRLEDSTGERYHAQSVILTAPIAQSIALLDRGGVPLPTVLRAALDAIVYAPCLALLVTLGGPSAVPDPGGLQLAAPETFSFVGDNQAKGISPVPAVTLHANDEVSAALFDREPDEAHAFLLGEAERFLGSAVVTSELKRWRYARPTTRCDERSLSYAPTSGTRIVFAGDAFGCGAIEGAALSGISVVV